MVDSGRGLAPIVLFSVLTSQFSVPDTHLKWGPQIEFLSISAEQSPGSVELDEVNVTVGLRSHLLQ